MAYSSFYAYIFISVWLSETQIKQEKRISAQRQKKLYPTICFENVSIWKDVEKNIVDEIICWHE